MSVASILKKISKSKKPLNIERLKKRTFCVGYDNGLTPGSSDNDCGARLGFVRFNWAFEVIGWEVNGQSVGAGETIGPFAGWSEQLQGWADFFNANDPNFIEDECEAAFGRLAAPTWRYTKITCCNPVAKYGPLTLRRDDGCIFTVYPVLTSDSLELASRYATLDCDGKKEVLWCDSDGDQIDAPENQNCFVPSSYVFDGYVYGPTKDCEQQVYNVCDSGTDPVTPYVVVRDICDGTIEGTTTYTLESWTTAESPDDLIEYTPISVPVNCATGEAFEFPESLDQQMLQKLCNIEELLTCEECEVEKSFTFSGFDYEQGEGFWGSGSFGADVNGTATVTPWGGPFATKSEYYTQMLDQINNGTPGWSVTVVNDPSATGNSDLVDFEFDYCGPAGDAAILTINRTTGTPDVLIMDANTGTGSFTDDNGEISSGRQPVCV